MENSVVVIKEKGLQLTSFDELNRFAECVSQSGLAPKGLEKPQAIIVAIQQGMELGLPPMMALQNTAVINGRPTVYGDVAKALVESSGLCIDFNEWFEGADDTLTACCQVQRVNRQPVMQKFSVEDAKAAGLWNKPGPWAQYKRRMLQMRARSFAIRDAFPDVLRGVAIKEELEGVEPTIKDVTPRDTSTARLAQLKGVLNIEPVGEPTEEDSDDGAPLPIVETEPAQEIDKGTLAINTLLDEMGFTSADAGAIKATRTQKLSLKQIRQMQDAWRNLLDTYLKAYPNKTAEQLRESLVDNGNVLDQTADAWDEMAQQIKHINKELF